MKNLILSGLMGIGLFGELSASTLENNLKSSNKDYKNLRVCGAGDKLSSQSYSGFGLQYQANDANVILEYGSDYTKASGAYKVNLKNDFYTKFGFGYLNREMLIESVMKDANQTTYGLALGYGDTKSYNIELGYIINDLDGAAKADGKSKTTYLELAGQHTFAPSATFDLVGSYKNTDVFNKNYTNSKIELGYFPVDDFRIHTSYDSVQHTEDDYSIRAGIEYTFNAKKPWRPFVKGSACQSSHITVGFEFSRDIVKKSLQMSDVFENSVATSDIVAQNVAGDIFASKTAKVTSTPTPPVVNQAPTGESFSVDADGNSANTVNLTSRINDADGDSMTVNYVGSGVLSGDIVINTGETGITGTNATITVSSGGGQGYIDYTVTDGTDTSPIYRITFTNLDGE